MSTPRDLPYWVAFSHLEEHWAVNFTKLRASFGSMAEAWQASSNQLLRAGLTPRSVASIETARKSLNVEECWKRVESLGIQLKTVDDDAYPQLLKQIAVPPPLLFVHGRLPPKDAMILAVVGTRRPTRYGMQMATDLVGPIGRAGLAIVSGLALGIDAVAHRATLESGGLALAVIGSGSDVIAPRTNHALAEAIIAAGGCLMTEYPPGTQPLPHHFPARNRIIAGLSRGVLVVEGDFTSGALITARFALEQNREVFAVPGPATSVVSRGPNELIKQGAAVATVAEDILNVFGITVKTEQLTKQGATEDERIILELLAREPLHIDELTRKSTLNPSVVNTTLALLEMRKLVRNLGGQHFALRRSP